jgi:hypothetical protein
MAQDLDYMRANLGASGMRRVLADLIDVGLAGGVAAILAHNGYNPWWCFGYFVVRDCIPLERSIGKLATGVQIRRADNLTGSSLTQRFVRGTVNTAILIPLGFLIATFMAFVFGFILLAGFILIVRGRDSIFLEMIGYDPATGRTIADRIAGTHLVTEVDLKVLQMTAANLESLRSEIDEGTRTIVSNKAQMATPRKPSD